jgi:hypothetical protein
VKEEEEVLCLVGAGVGEWSGERRSAGVERQTGGGGVYIFVAFKRSATLSSGQKLTRHIPHTQLTRLKYKAARVFG